MTRLVFLDTNVLLHYQDFDQVDWLSVAGADAVELIISPVNLRELNSIKDSQAPSRFRHRARKLQTKLSKLIDEGLSATLAPNVTLRVEHREPLIDYPSYDLVPSIPDDVLIAAILMYRQELPNADIALITSDDGLTLLAKARPRGIHIIKMPQRLRLPEEPDPDQQMINELEQRIRALTSAMPRLSLAFNTGAQHINLALAESLPLPSPDEQDERLQEVKNRYPHRPIPGKPSEDSSDRFKGLAALSAAYEAFLLPGENEVKRYNAELDKFYPAYAQYSVSKIHFENLQRRTIPLRISIRNDGTAPGEDIDIHMHFPDGLAVLTEDEVPTPPSPPAPPKLRTQFDLLAEQISPPMPLSALLRPQSLDTSALGPRPRNVSRPSIRRTNSIDVRIHVGKIKHTLQLPFDPLYAQFDSAAPVASFHIDYRIVAANIPTETSGQLHVVIETAANPAT